MRRVTVWYDGACPLCIREIALMRRLDCRDAVSFIDISVPAASCPLDRQLMLSRFHASVNGDIYTGTAAFAAMWRVIPVLRPIGHLARIPAVLRILEALYIQFLKIRPHIRKRFKPAD
ncbi:DUF393 domain-containing protein [uncultured Parasphingorhabdus sp.]|uniref:thiol-disulfide oxidoreductase DCC family protein n=1 Tax=uncultured Parasphingorhabdus sp. TaxID=2709694 RepID=UPI002AA83162|nr:DUF393 domain-containing protein [uncultured Parasphingorhabdus sp.]